MIITRLNKFPRDHPVSLYYQIIVFFSSQQRQLSLKIYFRMDFSKKIFTNDESNPEKPRIIATIEATEPTPTPLKPNPNMKKVNFDSKVHTKTFYADSSESEEEMLTDEIHNLSIQVYLFFLFLSTNKKFY